VKMSVFLTESMCAIYVLNIFEQIVFFQYVLFSVK